MKLLIITQKVDAHDHNLGFFVRWIETLAEHAGLIVIANEVGGHALESARVRVLSLGKERGVSRLQRFRRYRELLREHLPASDGVFFHMCPEYVLAAGCLPKHYGKKTLLWYVHKQVSWRLRIAVMLVDKIFTASKESCRLRGRKIAVVGHGIDSNTNYEQDTKLRKGTSATPHLITGGRISAVKDIATLLRGFRELQKSFPDAQFSIIGEPITNADRMYLQELQRIASDGVRFRGGVSP